MRKSINVVGVLSLYISKHEVVEYFMNIIISLLSCMRGSPM